ncbi:MAG: non-ribosomal peptide synthetase [Haliangiales bacterium]
MRDQTKSCPTFVDLVRARASERPDHPVFTFVSRSGRSKQTLTLGELDRRARAVAAQLIDRGLTGERALIAYPPGLSYVVAYFGCLYAGVIAVPIYPPSRGQMSARHLAIAADAKPAALVSEPALAAQLAQHHAGASGWYHADAGDAALAADAHERWQRPALDGDSLAFLQYTSGSTATPKGVMVTHRNLLANARAIQHAFATGPDTDAVIWLPPYHDMGLIGGILQPLYAGYRATLLPPVSFVLRPRTWLQAISDARAHISGGPNFAYDLCVDRVKPDELEGLDLSCWRVAFNGAEPIRASTMERFARAFAPCGFERSAFFPCYGLAEATLFVAGRRYDDDRATCTLRPDSLAPGQIAKPQPDGVTLVSSGAVAADTQVVIVDAETNAPCAPGQVGELWVTGDSIAAGYWERPRETASTFHAQLPARSERFLRTGDLGFLLDGQLYLTGRSKDLLIIRGRNHYPQDIERTVENAHPLLLANAGAAVSFEHDGREELAIAHEVHRRAKPDQFGAIIAAIRAALAREHGLLAHTIGLVRAGALPRTSSGKIQRYLCRQGLADGTLALVHRAAQRAPSSRQPSSRLPSSPLLDLTGSDQTLWPAAVNEQLRALLAGSMQAALDDTTPLVALGMDSLTALTIRSHIGRYFGVDIALDDLLGGINIDQLVERIIDRAGELSAAEPPPAAEPDPARARQPLALGQQALWFLEQQFPDTSAQHIFATVRFLTPLDEAALGRVMQALVDRHPVLRTALRAEAGEPYQIIAPHQPADFLIEDATDWSDARLRTRLGEEVSGRRFSLEQGNMLRAVLFRRKDAPVLSLVIHHIAADMWSLALLTEDLGRLYQVETGHNVEILPTAPESAFCDFARKQRALLDSPRGEQLWSYWREQLRGCKPALDLPSDRPRPRQQSYRGDTATFQVDADTTSALRALAAREDTTLFVLLLAVFQGLIHRYTAEEDFLLGIATSGRTDPAYHNVVGYFVNPLLIRAKLDSETRFEDHLRTTKATVNDALRHQDLPFPVLIERLKLPRDSSRSPGYQVLFSLTTPHLLRDQGMGAFQMGVRGARMKIGPLEVESVDMVRRTAQVDMTFVLSEVDDHLVGMINYSTDLFDRATMDRFASHYAHLAAHLARRPESAVGHGDILTAGERQRIAECGETHTDLSDEKHLAALFMDHVERQPDAPALSFGATELSYCQLARAATALARRLQALGAGPEQLVALSLDREAAVVIAMLATVFAGAAYVPLDPSHPVRRLRGIVDDCRARIVIARGAPHPELIGEGVTAIDIEPFLSESVWRDPANDKPVPCRASQHNLLYVMFTSGSSGAPKGIAITQRATIAFLVNRYLDIQPGDRVAQMSNAAFDASTFEIWGAYLRGAHLIGFDRNTVVSPPLLARALRERDITTMYLNSALLNQIVECAPDTFASVKQLFFGGEFADIKRIRTLLERHGPGLNHIYGTTETTGFSTWQPLTQVPRWATRLSVGFPIDNSSVYVLDQHLQHQPFGVPGEIYIGGAGVARGYIHKPAQTAERFVPDPYCGSPGARMYATGDLGRRLPDGAIEMIGRMDFQVKVRGFRIELEEIEAAALDLPGVREAVVILDPTRPDDKRLLGYFAGDATADAVRAFLSDRVPEYMVPNRFIKLDALPKTASGKVSRAALPTPTEEPAAATSSPASPGDTLEGAIAAVFAQLLGVSHVDPEVSFFDLGGHSLLATKLLVHISDQYGVDLPLNELFNNPTPRAMAAYLGRVKAKDAAPGQPDVDGPRRVSRRAHRRAKASLPTGEDSE